MALLAVAGLVLATAGGWLAWHRPAVPSRPIGLFTSLPLLWPETAELGTLVSGGVAPHWAKGMMEQRGAIVPLDTLEGLQSDLRRLVIAQPRPLSPAENVALDVWVRQGGALVLLADPILVQESAFAPGDPRRPQDVVLLSPILTRWGLELRFDEAQPGGRRLVEAEGATIPVNLPGAWRAASPTCRISSEGLIARCPIGQGYVLAVADADLLAQDDPDGRGAAAFDWLLETAFRRP